MAVSGGQQASRGESDPSHSRPASSSNFLQFQWPLPLLPPPHPHLLLILPPFSLKEIGQKTWSISQKQPNSSTYTYCTPLPQIRLSSLLRCLVATSLVHSCNFTPVDWCAESGRDAALANRRGAGWDRTEKRAWTHSCPPTLEILRRGGCAGQTSAGRVSRCSVY